mmetsp:Transcript_5002/g.5145  ORF Transcript_5002/g.5145 Transcript_5002/m.5145 type:complete len:181 (-) Transcript_5002:91-633(-)
MLSMFRVPIFRRNPITVRVRACSELIDVNKNENQKHMLHTIYKLVCNNKEVKEVYVGYTTLELKNMLKFHQRKCTRISGEHYNRKLYETIRATGGPNNWSAIVLEECYNIEETKQKKREWMEKTPYDMNMIKRPSITPVEAKRFQREYNKEYRLKKMAELLSVQKIHDDNPREERKETKT